jgi:hypothetical protein
MTMSVFNTYNDLVAATPSAGDTALLLGYNAKGDGGGGEFYWDSASTATPHGSIIVQPGGGGTGRWFRVLGQDGPVNVKWFGAAGDGSTDDKTAIDAAIAYCVAKNRTLELPDGTYLHSGAINWAYNSFHVAAPGDNVVFVHTGTGVAHNFSGVITYPTTKLCLGGVFGGPGRIMLKGNPAGGTTRGVNIDNWHFGSMKVAIKDCATCLYGADSASTGSSSVCTTFDVRIGGNADGPMTVTPGHGVDFSAPVACIFEKLIVELCGASGNKAAVFTDMINCTFRGGTIEGNLAGGLLVANSGTGSSRNTYQNLEIETNGSAADWTTAERYPVLINCSTGGTASGSVFNSTGAILLGGTFTSLVVNDNTLWSNGTEFLTSFTDNGTSSTFINPLGGLTIAKDYAPGIVGFKTINTQNAVTLKINGNTVNAVTGTGSTVALQTDTTLNGTTSAATLKITNPITTSWSIDGTDSAILIAGGSTAAVAVGSGYLFIFDTTTGHFCNVSVGGGVVTINSQDAAQQYVVTSSPSASQTGLYYSGTNYTIKNGFAAAHGYGVTGIRLSPVN